MIVRESIEFKRGKDIKRSLDIGHTPPEPGETKVIKGWTTAAIKYPHRNYQDYLIFGFFPGFNYVHKNWSKILEVIYRFPFGGGNMKLFYERFPEYNERNI